MDKTAPEKIPFLRDPAKLAILYQFLTLAGVGLLSYYLISNTMANLERQSISTGFGFLEREAAFEIGETLIQYGATDSYGRALTVGFLNTLVVAFIGIVLTVLLGTFLGIARLSTNWLVAKLSAWYIEFFQDIPILLQLFFWYAFFYEILPAPRQALNPIPGVFLCNRGLIFGIPHWHGAYMYAALAFIGACAMIFFIRRWAEKRQAATGRIFPLIRCALALLIGLPLIAWWLTGAPTAMNVPQLAGFNFKGGISISPEFTALLLGLVLYTAAFVAEVVRAGIQSVGKGQREAAMSIGLKPAHVLNLVILPQALRNMIPSFVNQFVSMIKDTSLAFIVGVSELTHVATQMNNRTMLYPTEIFLFIAVIYFIMCFAFTELSRWLERRSAWRKSI